MLDKITTEAEAIGYIRAITPKTVKGGNTKCDKIEPFKSYHSYLKATELIGKKLFNDLQQNK